MNGHNPGCVFKSCPNAGETKLALTTGPMHYMEDKESAGGRMVFWVCPEHSHADVNTLATSWDGQRVAWEPDLVCMPVGMLSETPAIVQA